MKNKNAIIVILALIIFAGGAVFAGTKLLKRPTSQDSSQNKSQEKTANTNEETDVNGSIFDLISLGKNVKCTYSSADGDTSFNGTTYISGTNMRGDFETGTNGTNINGHMITDGEWVYTWNSENAQGFKMKIDDAYGAQDNTDNVPENQSLSTLNDTFDYKCINWVPNNSVFTVPQDITFTDFTKLLEDMNVENPGGDAGSACTACNFIPDEDDKASCKSQLGCD